MWNLTLISSTFSTPETVLKMTDSGADGYGRDSSLAFVRSGVLAVTYMNYSHATTHKQLKMALLIEATPPSSL